MIARFYGFSHSDIEAMDMDIFCSYLNCIKIIEAKEALSQLTISDWPHLKKDCRAKIHKQLYKIAYPKTSENRKATTEDIARILNGR